MSHFFFFAYMTLASHELQIHIISESQDHYHEEESHAESESTSKVNETQK
jgi:hypothetical protein